MASCFMRVVSSSSSSRLLVSRLDLATTPLKRESSGSSSTNLGALDFLMTSFCFLISCSSEVEAGLPRSSLTSSAKENWPMFLTFRSCWVCSALVLVRFLSELSLMMLAAFPFSRKSLHCLYSSALTRPTVRFLNLSKH